MLNRLFSPKSLDEYRRFREVGRTLNQKIIKALVDSEIIGLAARALNLGKNRQIVVDTEDDLSVLMDFALYELRRDGKSLVELYETTKGGSDQLERELLSAMVKARTGLFRVDTVLRSTRQLWVKSLLDDEKLFKLTDINCSQTVCERIIMFMRPIELPGLAMTSGIAFDFPATMEQELVRRWHRESTSARRYAALFKLSKRRGLTTEYADV